MKSIINYMMLVMVIPVMIGLPGDINHDGIIDGYDLSLLAKSYGAKKGDTDYEIDADLTGNGHIGEHGLSILLTNFGRSVDDDEPLKLVKSGTESSDYTLSISDSLHLDESYSVLRYRYVQLNEDVTGGIKICPGDTVYLNLFDDLEYLASIERIFLNVNGTIAVRGKITNTENGYFIVSTTAGISMVTVTLPGGEYCYSIVHEPDSGHYFLGEFDSDALDILAKMAPVLPPTESIDEIGLQKCVPASVGVGAFGPEDHAVLDMMIVYTPAAEEWASSRGGIDNIISQAMERTQLTFENSRIIASANLVYSGLVDYVESGSSYIDLYRLTTSPDHKPWGDTHEGHKITGYMDEVHSWRDVYGADLVSLFAVVYDVGGLGFQLMTPTGRPQYAFSLTRVQQAAISYTHVHETGHNMGAHHHREQLESPGPGIFTYSAGWRWAGNDNGRYCSVMTYGSGQYFADGNRHVVVPYFSNPDTTYANVATGHSWYADNARTLRETKHVVASYRTASSSPPAAPTDLRYTVTSTPAVQLTWQNNAGNAVRFIVEKRSEGDWRRIGVTSGSKALYIDKDISFNTTQYYRVAAFNHMGSSGYSNTVEVTIGMGW